MKCCTPGQSWEKTLKAPGRRTIFLISRLFFLSLSHQSRGERHFSASFPGSNRRSTVGSNYTNDHELTVIDNPGTNGGKEIW